MFGIPARMKGGELCLLTCGCTRCPPLFKLLVPASAAARAAYPYMSSPNSCMSM